ncbi:MAG: fumarylacetoacetate hydrolase family protein [Bacteroidota bacterium]
MHLYRFPDQICLFSDNQWYLSPIEDWDQLINRQHLHSFLLELLKDCQTIEAPQALPLAPIGQQEVWASGVTYLRSKVARMEEAKNAGGGDFYDRVYDADRPEIFFKASPQRVVGPGGNLHIRRDSSWDVPEPELTLFVSTEGSIEAYTIGNDMSSRSIEGENPLYLPQAKTYDACAGLGPCLFVPPQAISSETQISMKIKRESEIVFADQIALTQMKRQLPELVDYLYRECSFPHGSFLMTGTGIIPPDEFSLQVGDQVEIEITGIGILQHNITYRQD